MELVHAAILGLVEGLTEFLPVSSTGHLILAQDFLGFHGPASDVFPVIIQLGAILAIVWEYRAKFWHVATGVRANKGAQYFVRNIALAFIPAMLLGALAHEHIKTMLFNPHVVAWALIVGGVLIILVEKLKPRPHINSTENMGWKTALAIGFYQCIALIPGVSRSGATIMGALLCKVERRAAAEFSFFLAVPVMMAATVYDVYKNYASFTAEGMEVIAVGFLSAFITALVVVKWLVRYVQTNDFLPFAYYRIAIGVVLLAFVY